MPNMLTLEDYKAFVPSVCSADASQIQPLLDAANALAEKFCNRTFYKAQSFTGYTDLPPCGQKNEIPLGRRPVNSITSVNFDSAGGYGQLTNTFGSDTLLTAGEDYYFEPGSDILRILRMRTTMPPFGMFFGYGGYGYPFGTNIRNVRTGCVKIVLNAGYTAFPADLLAGIAGLASWMLSGGIESGGRVVSSYIDVSISSATAMDALGYGNVPALGTARDILLRYKETAVPAQGRW